MDLRLLPPQGGDLWGRESQLSSGPRLLHVDTMSTTCKTSLSKVSTWVYWTCSKTRARAAGVAMSGLVHWFRMSLRQAALARMCSHWASLPTTTRLSCWPSRRCSSG
ncbi:hypothetical protein EYF80_047991 [Liparis tanakae]|uniref:Uncharacterized protein n=1 Tax=Liparis tanakae TaxID=230148 RepID=A0A4Z2FKS8_9TELE|nr:hypothetical protein EYF80_047991 [Liparis tanakae]